MSDVNVALQAVIDSIASKAATAAPSDLAYLGKALEAVAPGSQTSLIVQIGGAQVEAVETAGAAQVTAVIAAVNAAGESKVAEINAAVLGGTATLVQFTTSALVVSLPNTVRPTVYVKADPILAMSQVSLRLPDATAVATAEIEIRNTSWSVVILRDSTNTATFGYIPPQSKRIARVTHPWASGWTIEAMSPPMLMPDFRSVLVAASALTLPGDWGSTTNVSNPSYGYSSNSYYAEPGYVSPYGLSLVCDSWGNPLALAALRLFTNSGVGNSFLGWTRKDLGNLTNGQFTSLGSSVWGYDNNTLSSGNAAANNFHSARSHGWKSLAVTAMYQYSLLGNSGVNLYVADFTANRNTAVRVAAVQSSSEIALIPFMDDRTFVVIVPSTGGRSVYRYVVDAGGAVNARGMMSFSTNASFVKLSINRLLVIDGGASAIYSMDDSGSTMTLMHALPSAVYNLCGVNGAFGASLGERVAVLGDATFTLENNGTVSGRTNSYAGFGEKNRMHVGGGVFVNADQSLGYSSGSAVLRYVDGGNGAMANVTSQHGLTVPSSSMQFYFAPHSEGVATLVILSSSTLDTALGATGSRRWDMSLNCLVRDQ